MPITFQLDQGVVVTTARGILSLEDVLEHVAAKKGAGVIAGPELFDARDVTLDLSITELKAIAAAMSKALDGQSPGTIAVVTNSNFLHGLAASYGELTRDVNQDFKVCGSVHEARSWIFDRSSTSEG